MKIRPTPLVAFVCLALSATGAALASPAYFRYPDIHSGRIVFAAEGDLWIGPESGGAARRLTTHPGTELFPRFSPDGRTIAFTGEYDGNRDVYVMSADGGEPRRLTWHPASDEVLEWSPDGSKILFRSRRDEPHGASEIYQVPAAGGDAEKLPLGWCERIDVDPSSGMWAFNRKNWERATWKRYRGGTAPDIWVGDPKTADYRKVTDFSGINAFPMWHRGRIWFLSDRGGTMNIWSMRPDGSELKRHTNFTGWDARWPGMGPEGRIVFTLGADLHVFDTSTGNERRVDIDLPSDRATTRVRYPDPGRTLTWMTIAPKGDRIALVTRGEIFSVPVKDGVTLPITRGSGARESWAGFDPEGKRIVYVTDAPREEEIRSIDAWGRGEPKVIVPAGTSGWHFPPVWSPDGKWIAFADQTQSLHVVPAGGGAKTPVDHSLQDEIRQYVWSPDGRWLAYAKTERTEYASIWVYDTTAGKTQRITGPYTNDRDPAWDPEGRYLYFVSDRATNPVVGTRDWENVEVLNRRLFMVLLRKDVKNPLTHQSGLPDSEDASKDDDEATSGDGAKDKGKDSGKKAKDGKDDAKKDDESKPPRPVKIDLEGIERRIVELPVDRGLYAGLQATKKKVFYLSSPVTGMAQGPGVLDEPEPEAELMAFDLEDKEETSFLKGVSAYAIAAKADKMAVMKKRGEIYVVKTDAPPTELPKAKVPLSNVVIELDPAEEWAQIYYEGWRHMRDFFWDEGLSGIDWKAVRDRYATLLPRLAVRDDLRDLMGEVIGELSNSHTYVFGGDAGATPARVSTGLLGADLVRDGNAYRIARIYRGDPADNVLGPLDVPGVNVSEGDYILAVNHTPFAPGRPIESYLANTTDKEIVLTVNSKNSTQGARDTVVKPEGSEHDVRYADWVRRNREYVASKTGGKVGYVHLPDMWTDGLVAFNTWFYPQLGGEGLVVDCRWNGGGAVSQMIVERLARRLVSFDRARGGGIYTYPQRVLNGPFVVLTNEFAGSDGDIFPYSIQMLGLAPVIGMRSWGGVVGIRGDKYLVDGGALTQPEFAWWDSKQGWKLENHGVDPDIEVQNMPQDVARGVDAQLDRAISEVLRLREQHPPSVPKFGPARGRARDAYDEEMKGVQ